MDPERPGDTWESGHPYERYVGRWSRRVAPRFLDWLQVPAGRRWLDVGCGTGALCSAILESASPASVVGVEPSEGFLETARAHLADRATLHQGDAMKLPLGEACVDVAVSGLVLTLFRHTGALALLLSLHLGTVMALFLTMPYGRFAHGVYRAAALLKWSIEKRQPLSLKLGSE